MTSHRRSPIASAMSPAGWSPTGCHWTAIKPNFCGARHVDVSISYRTEHCRWRHSCWTSEVYIDSDLLMRTHVQRSFKVLCRATPTAADSSLSVNQHVPDAGGYLSANASGLRLQRAGRSSGLPGSSTAVSAERGCATDIPSASIRPHHRRACLPPLVARAGASSVQDCRSGLPSPARTRSAIPRSTQLCRRLAWPPTSPFCCTNRLAVPLVKITTVANWALPVVGQRTWNDLPDDVTSAESLSTFRQRLKTQLFTKFFFWLFPGLDFT